MGHSPGFPCIVKDPEHDGACTTPVVTAGFVDLDRTRYFEVTESNGGLSYWRSNASAARCKQVEYKRPDGRWHTSFVFDTEHDLEQSLNGCDYREIAAEEVPSDG